MNIHVLVISLSLCLSFGNKFMQVVEAAVEARKVHILQQDTHGEEAKIYSFPVDSHLSQLTVHVATHKRGQAIDVRIRNPQSK